MWGPGTIAERKKEEAGRKRGELVSEAAQPTCGFAL